MLVSGICGLTTVSCGDRLTNPIEDADVMKVGSLFNISNLLEQVAKARKRVSGAMFPRHVNG